AMLCDLREGETEAAATKTRTMLAMVKGMAEERLIISQLVRIAIAHVALTANWELLQSPGVTEQQLAALQRDWTEIQFLSGAEHALIMERAMSEAALARMRKSSAEFRRMANGWGSRSSSGSGDWWEG